MRPHGYVVAIGPESNPNYFTGVAYSAHLNDAKVFRTKGGALSAVTHWQTADHNPSPLTAGFWTTRRSVAVTLQIQEPSLL